MAQGDQFDQCGHMDLPLLLPPLVLPRLPRSQARKTFKILLKRSIAVKILTSTLEVSSGCSVFLLFFFWVLMFALDIKYAIVGELNEWSAKK